MGISHNHGVDVPDDLLAELRRMVALGAAAQSAERGDPSPSVLRRAKAFEDYIKSGSVYGG